LQDLTPFFPILPILPRSHLEVRVEEEKENGVIAVHLKGAATFMRLPQLASALELVPPDAHVHVYFHELSFIDHACLDILVNWEKQHTETGGELVIDWDALHGIFQRHAWGGNAAQTPRAD